LCMVYCVDVLVVWPAACLFTPLVLCFISDWPSLTLRFHMSVIPLTSMSDTMSVPSWTTWFYEACVEAKVEFLIYRTWYFIPLQSPVSSFVLLLIVNVLSFVTFIFI
jgi:hypothetical protein